MIRLLLGLFAVGYACWLYREFRCARRAVIAARIAERMIYGDPPPNPWLQACIDESIANRELSR